MNFLEEIIEDLIPKVTLLGANHYIIRLNNVEYFQSYNSIIGMRSDKYTFLDEYYWNYSKITSKFRIKWLEETTTATRNKIEAGEYILKNFNKSK